jgi:membrane-associated protease RseP (regulator of RpoE activity)
VQRGEQQVAIIVRLGERPASVVPPAEPVPAPGEVRRPARPQAESVPSAPAPTEVPAVPRPATAGTRTFLGVRVSEDGDGLWIEDVLAESPAAAAGLRSGERITRIGDEPIRARSHVDRALAGARPGQKVMVQVASDGGVRSVPVTLGEWPLALAREAAAGHETAPITPVTEAPKALDGQLELLRNEIRELRREIEELRLLRASERRRAE